MPDTGLIDAIEAETQKLLYIAEKEDEPGLSNILLDIADNLDTVKNALKIVRKSKKGGEDAEEDGRNL